MNKPKGTNRKLLSKMAEYCREYCSCGHSMIITPSRSYTYCSHCGRKVKNKTKGRFRYILLGKMHEYREIEKQRKVK